MDKSNFMNKCSEVVKSQSTGWQVVNDLDNGRFSWNACKCRYNPSMKLHNKLTCTHLNGSGCPSCTGSLWDVDVKESSNRSYLGTYGCKNCGLEVFEDFFVDLK